MDRNGVTQTGFLALKAALAINGTLCYLDYPQEDVAAMIHKDPSSVQVFIDVTRNLAIRAHMAAYEPQNYSFGFSLPWEAPKVLILVRVRV
jgi:hypothetical protein